MTHLDHLGKILRLCLGYYIEHYSDNCFLANVELREILVNIAMEYVSIVVKLCNQLKIDTQHFYRR
jgi:hypothetical protein